MRIRRGLKPRTLMKIAVALALASAYVGSYARFSRRSLVEAESLGIGGLLYTAPQQVEAARGPPLRHDASWLFYWPVNQLDQAFFNGPPPVRSILFELSG